jgi:CDP-diacylglycerol---glycerol-3-phosphate 3-phosphatidyltransferase
MNLPNKLTVSRIIVTFIGVTILFFEQIPFSYLIAAGIFVFAVITDILDGYIARKHNMVTKLGTFLDPISDKLLFVLYFLFLQSMGLYPLWLLIVFVARELIVDAIRSYAASQNVFFGAVKSGKIKASLQATSIIAGLLYLSPFIEIPYLGEFTFYTMIAALIISFFGKSTLVKDGFNLIKE